MARTLIAALLLVLTTGVSLAQHKHPQDIAKIDAVLPSAQISQSQKAQVIKLRNDGERLHATGQHGAAETVLERAKAILKIR